MTDGFGASMPRVVLDTDRLDAIFSGLDTGHLPGAAVGIAINGVPAYRAGFGVASMELPVLLGPSMRLRICSVTKQFTALAYMLLCEEGKAGIDDSIGQYVPEIHPASRGATMRQLMGNVSGIRDVHGLCWQLSGMEPRVSASDLLSLYRSIDDVNFRPRTAYSYNNGGWLLVSTAIERIADRSLEDVFAERIFRPLGMYDTVLRRTDTDFLANCATMHMVCPAGRFERFVVGTAVAGEGGIVSTVDDMLRWLTHIDEPRVGCAETWAAIRTPQTLLNGSSTGYGFGLAVGQYRGVQTLSHPGGWMGGNAHVLKVPGARLDVVVLVNRHDVASTLLVNQILDACIPDLAPRSEAQSSAVATGTFRSESSGRVIRLLGEQGRQIASVDSMNIPMDRNDDGTLRPAEIMGFLKQSIELLGNPERPTVIRFNDFGNIDELTLVQATGGSPRPSIGGRYRSDATCTDAVIDESEDDVHWQSVGRFGTAHYDLEHLGMNLWLAKSTSSATQWSGILTFEGNSRGYRVSTWSNWGLRFRRV